MKISQPRLDGRVIICQGRRKKGPKTHDKKTARTCLTPRVPKSAMPVRQDIATAQSALQRERGVPLLCYVTSIRWNFIASISDDASRVICDHVARLAGDDKATAIDVFLISNGGDGTAAWKIISYLREFFNKISVLVPSRAYSAATLFSLGADEIVMGPFGQLGPIDPKVQNDFNPDTPGGQKVSISVEDVKS